MPPVRKTRPTTNKDNFYKIKYVFEEERGDATIKSTVSIMLEDAGILPSESLESILEKGAEIAKQEYLK